MPAPSEEECPCLKLETGGPQHLEKRKNLIKAVCVLLMLITVAKIKLLWAVIWVISESFIHIL